MTFTYKPVDLEIRKKLVTEVKEHKVNQKTEKFIDNKMKRPMTKEWNKDYKNKKNNKNKKNITIDGIKSGIDTHIEVEAVRSGDSINDKLQGMFIDHLK